jgi:hypothetical protein
MHGERPDVRLALLGFAAAALGLLSKGLIGLALPGLVLLIWLAWTRQLRKILRLPWLRGLAILALLALPWFVLAQAQFADMLGYMFGKHQFGRYTGTTFNNGRPWWFYLPCLVLLMFPWVLFIRPLRARRPDTGPADSAPNAAWLSLLWIWLLAIVGFFSIPNSKLVGYVLPVMPPLALLAALGWGQWMRNKPGQAPKLLHALALLAVLGAVVVTGVAGRYSDKKGTADIARTLACQASVGDTVYAVGDYPYDLPFYTGASRPMVVIQDWAEQRRSAGDNWRRELFEGANIDPLAGQVLQGPEALAPASQRPGNWLVMPRGTAPEQRPGQWVEVQQGQAWTLLRSDPVESGGGAAGKGPEATEHKGLPGCKHQGNDQRQH